MSIGAAILCTRPPSLIEGPRFTLPVGVRCANT
jgi:hypothetical protein